MQINQDNLADLYKSFRVVFNEAMQGAKPQWPDLATKTTSTAAVEIYKWLGAVPGLEEIIGEIARSNLLSAGLSVFNRKFGKIIPIPREDIERDQYGVYNPLMAAMGLAAAQNPDRLVADAMLGGFTAKAYTGKNFFDVNHDPTVGARRTATLFTNKGTDKLSPTSFKAARLSLTTRLNAEGRPMNLGTDLLLVVSPQNEDMAKKILQMDYVMQTAKNTGTTVGGAGVSNVQKGQARFKTFGYLAADSDKWFLLDMGQPIKPFIYQEEVAPRLTARMSEDSDSVFNEDKFEYKSYARGAAAALLPEFAFGSNGTTDPGDLS